MLTDVHGLGNRPSVNLTAGQRSQTLRGRHELIAASAAPDNGEYSTLELHI
jgi:hypothetical protein